MNTITAQSYFGGSKPCILEDNNIENSQNKQQQSASIGVERQQVESDELIKNKTLIIEKKEIKKRKTMESMGELMEATPDVKLVQDNQNLESQVMPN